MAFEDKGGKEEKRIPGMENVVRVGNELFTLLFIYACYRVSGGTATLALNGRCGIGKTTTVNSFVNFWVQKLGLNPQTDVLEWNPMEYVGKDIEEELTVVRDGKKVPKYKVMYIVHDLATIKPEDMFGVPWIIKGKYVLFMPPAEFFAASFIPLLIVYYDDFQNADIISRRQLFEFIRVGRMGTVQVKNLVPIIAFNPQNEDPALASAEIPPALWDRMIVVNVAPPDLTDWLEARKKKFKPEMNEKILEIIKFVNPFDKSSRQEQIKELIEKENLLVEGFLRAYVEHFMKPMEFVKRRAREIGNYPSKGTFPTPRSWREAEKLLNVLSLNPLFGEDYLKAVKLFSEDESLKRILLCLLSGLLSADVAVEFVEQLDGAFKFDVYKFMDTGDLKYAPTWKDGKFTHYVFVDCLLAACNIKDPTTIRDWSFLRELLLMYLNPPENLEAESEGKWTPGDAKEFAQAIIMLMEKYFPEVYNEFRGWLSTADPKLHYTLFKEAMKKELELRTLGGKKGGTP